MPMPFGPEGDNHERMIVSLEDKWVARAALVYPKLIPVLEANNWPFGFILVNPPREATVEEVEHFKERGIELDEDW